MTNEKSILTIFLKNSPCKNSCLENAKQKYSPECYTTFSTSMCISLQLPNWAPRNFNIRPHVFQHNVLIHSVISLQMLLNLFLCPSLSNTILNDTFLMYLYLIPMLKVCLLDPNFLATGIIAYQFYHCITISISDCILH